MTRALLSLCLMLPILAWGIEGRVTKSDKDIQVPALLVQEIEQTYIKRVRTEDPVDIRTDLQLKMEIPREMLGLKLHFEKQGGKSLEENVTFKIPAGGAQIDISSYVREGRGLFTMRMELTEAFVAEEDLKHLRVYFVPRYQRQIQGSQTHGVGCDHFIEITKYFKNEILQKGVLLTTTNEAYFSVIAGSYIFVVTQPTGLKIASLSLMDARYKNFLCGLKAGR